MFSDEGKMNLSLRTSAAVYCTVSQFHLWLGGCKGGLRLFLHGGSTGPGSWLLILVDYKAALIMAKVAIRRFSADVWIPESMMALNGYLTDMDNMKSDVNA